MSELNIEIDGTMLFSTYDGINDVLTFLSHTLADEESADIELVYLTPNKVDGINTLTFSIASGVSATLSPMTKGGSSISRAVAVNLYDLWNAVTVLKIDDVIYFSVDEDAHELVVEGFYNDDKDLTEVEVRLPVKATDFDMGGELPSYDEVTSVFFDPTIIHTLMQQIDIHNADQDVEVVFSGESVAIYVDENNSLQRLTFPNVSTRYSGDDFSVKIPIKILVLLCSTGDINGLILSIGSDIITAKVDRYTFNLPSTIITTPINVEVPEVLDDVFVASTTQLPPTLDTMARLNGSNKAKLVGVSKYDEENAQLYMEGNGRYKLSVIAPAAVLKEGEFKFDLKFLQRLFKLTYVDAIKVTYSPENGRYYIKTSSPIFDKIVEYTPNDGQ